IHYAHFAPGFLVRREPGQMRKGIIILVNPGIGSGLRTTREAICGADRGPVEALVSPLALLRDWIFRSLKVGRVGLRNAYNWQAGQSQRQNSRDRSHRIYHCSRRRKATSESTEAEPSTCRPLTSPAA